MRAFLKFVGVMLFLGLFLGVSAKLFFPKQFADYLAGFNSANEDVSPSQVLRIAYALGPDSFEPTSYNFVNRSWMIDVYEGLVSLDENMNIYPALALSWGQIDDLVWEFKLRPDVRFHDERTVNAGDVQFSIDRAKNFPGSELKNLLGNIVRVDVIDQYTVHVVTSVYDPLFLNKLAAVYIVPYRGDNFDNKPMGTGKYRMVNFIPGKEVDLEYFPFHWDKIDIPHYKKVQMLVISDKQDRVNALMTGDVDLLSQVPPSAVETLESFGAEVIMRPTLQSNFLVFNANSSDNTNIFAHKEIRQAVLAAIDQKKIVEFTRSFGYPATQFVARNVFGYNPEIKLPVYDPDKAKELVRSVDSFARLRATLDLTEGMDLLGEYLKDRLFEIGIDLDVNYLDLPEIQEKVTQGKSQFYFLGWQAELGDAGSFYRIVVHSSSDDGKYGVYNYGVFQNSEIDSLIEESESLFDRDGRLVLLRHIMNLLVNEEVFGVPLFEPEVVYATREGIAWTPRMDGYISAATIK